ncbi:hypothetical protein JTB14_006151 [Gonioctena quinquepunctata]|nr:hypothetical protein JTB14_006151 [Gonioctena quinquepunctata]
MGGFGGLRRGELVKMIKNDREDKGRCLLVEIPETRIGTSKGFSIVEEEKIGSLRLVRKCLSSKQSGVKDFRFFGAPSNLLAKIP